MHDQEAIGAVVFELGGDGVAGAGRVLECQVIQRGRGFRQDGARIGLISLGGGHRALLEAVDELGGRGLPVDYLRIRAFPFAQSVRSFIDEHERIFVVEQNRDAQLRSLLLIETESPAAKLESVLRYGGLPLSARHVVEDVVRHMSKGNGA